MTEKLYYADSHLFTFRAKVLRCEQDGECWYNDKYCSDYYQYMN